MFIYAVEAWAIPDTEEPCELKMIDSAEFDSPSEAEVWAFQRMLDGFQTRIYLRAGNGNS